MPQIVQGNTNLKQLALKNVGSPFHTFDPLLIATRVLGEATQLEVYVADEFKQLLWFFFLRQLAHF